MDVGIVKPKSQSQDQRDLGVGLTLKSHGPPPFKLTFKHEGQRNKGRGVVLHVQEEVYQSSLIFRRRVAGYQE